MSILSNKFVLTKGMINEFVIKIKKDGAMNPIAIKESDTFEFIMYDIDTDLEVGRVSKISNSNGVISTYSAVNGQIKIVLNLSFVNSLLKVRGPKEDRYYIKPKYRANLNCNTFDNGHFIPKILEIYVD